MDLIHALNSREQATVIWAVIFLVWAMRQEGVRSSLAMVVRAALQWKLVALWVAMSAYVALLTVLLFRLHLWGYPLLKDTLFWMVGAAAVELMNYSAMEKPGYFRKLMGDALKLTVVIQFIVGMYCFSLWAELVLVPLLGMLAGMSVVADSSPQYRPAKTLTDFLLGALGLLIAGNAVYHAVAGASSLASATSLRALALPAFLTVGFIPFSYAFALIANYESLFVRLRLLMRDDEALCRFAKSRILTLCHINLRRLGRLSREGARVAGLRDKKAVLDMIRDFRHDEMGRARRTVG